MLDTHARTRRYAPILLALSLAAACASKEAARSDTAEEVATEATTATDKDAVEKRPISDGEAATTGVEDLVRTNNAFAFDVYRALRTEHFVVSPHALAASLAIVHAASDSESRAEVKKTLRYDADEQDMQEQFRRLHEVLRTRATPVDRDQKRGFGLLVSAGVWTSADIEPTADFLRVANNHHFATVEGFDFANAGKAAATKINTHYNDVTNGRIGDVLTDVEPSAKVYVTHTVQYDAPWTLPFERGLTEDAQFAAPDGARTVPMMHGRARVGYLEGDGFQLVELPYGDGRVSAWIVLPSEDKAAFDATITADFFEWMVSSARQQNVEVRLPRFEVTSHHELEPVLRTMGMPSVFDPKRADLSGLAADDDLYLEELVQVARVKVDEDGSDAMATTRGSVTPPGGKLPQFEASRPFLFVVRDNPTGSILMMVRVATP